MYFKVVKKFGPEDAEKWQSYLEWRGLDLTRFDSADGILRPDLFEPESSEDWSNCINENFKICLITNLEYAQKVLSKFESADLIGVDVEVEESYEPTPGFLGYDILDGFWGVSLVTNWGNDEEGIFEGIVKSNGLISDLSDAITVRDFLKKEFCKDQHAENCEVWGIYETNT